MRRLFSRPAWNRLWLYDSALALGTLDALVLGNGVDQALSGAGWSPTSAFTAGLFSMAIVALACVVVLRLIDVSVPHRLPVLGGVRTQFRLLTLPAAVVVSWLGTFAGLRVALAWLSPPVAVCSAFVLANVVALLSCWILVARRQPTGRPNVPNRTP